MSNQKLRLSDAEKNLLYSLIGYRVRQIVWDLNALYIVLDTTTIKIEAVVETPDSLNPTDYDEACVIRVLPEGQNFTFLDQGETEHWYRVIARNEQILDIEVVGTVLLMPSEKVLSPNDEIPVGQMPNSCHCGIVLTIKEGLLPAIQLHNSWGFLNWPVRLYSREEVMQRLDKNYRLDSVAGASA